MATIIYNDRVVSWKQMQQLDESLDKKPTEQQILNMVELRVRNIQAFNELQAFNCTGDFLYVHPLIVHQSERAKLEALLRTEPQEFLRRHRNASDNVKRYTAYLKREDRQAQRIQDKEHLKRHRERETLFKTILQNLNTGNSKPLNQMNETHLSTNER